MDDTHYDDALEACGRAFGVTIAMALGSDPNTFRTRAGLKNFARLLHDMNEAERFQPAVGLVMSNVVAGILAALAMKPDSGEII
jgi:hypothetical protein